jgi:hypothetical protein
VATIGRKELQVWESAAKQAYIVEHDYILVFASDLQSTLPQVQLLVAQLPLLPGK